MELSGKNVSDSEVKDRGPVNQDMKGIRERPRVSETRPCEQKTKSDSLSKFCWNTIFTVRRKLDSDGSVGGFLLCPMVVGLYRSAGYDLIPQVI